MKIFRPLWNEGALLSPQQFQQQSAWEAFTNAGVLGLSPDEVNAVSINALNGIPLIPVMRMPAALPVRLENHYFALDMESAAARDMLEQGVCMFYVPSLLGALEIELFAVLRS